MGLWCCVVLLFWDRIKNGSPEPKATQAEPLEAHGKTVYVIPTDKRRVDALLPVLWVGIPLVLVSGAILHFLVGVKLFPNSPTLPEYQNRGPNRAAP